MEKSVCGCIVTQDRGLVNCFDNIFLFIQHRENSRQLLVASFIICYSSHNTVVRVLANSVAQLESEVGKFLCVRYVMSCHIAHKSEEFCACVSFVAYCVEVFVCVAVLITVRVVVGMRMCVTMSVLMMIITMVVCVSVTMVTVLMSVNVIVCVLVFVIIVCMTVVVVMRMVVGMYVVVIVMMHINSSFVNFT